MLRIRPETLDDHAAVREVNRLAFGGEAEARLVDLLREGGHARVSLVAEKHGRVVGHILLSAMAVETDQGRLDALALAPMAVLPEFQRQGIGSRLIRRGLDACRDLGGRIVLVVGHPEYYPRFGFSPRLVANLASPYACEALMALELVPGALQGVTGTVLYPPPFGQIE